MPQLNNVAGDTIMLNIPMLDVPRMGIAIFGIIRLVAQAVTKRLIDIYAMFSIFPVILAISAMNSLLL